ncbi:MAG: CRP-like cAMP-binding protein [Verrucomicrobiales bacterium]|jgi:CRP-like cAMP-binding protein
MVGILDESGCLVDEDNQQRLIHVASQIFGELHVSAGIELMNLGRFKDIGAGETCIRQGQPQSDLVIILTGQLKVHCQANGQAILLAKLDPGETVGEIGMLDRGNASATVIATQPTRVWSLGRDAFEDFVRDYPEDGVRLFWVLSQRLCKRLRRSSEKMLKQAERVRVSYLDHDHDY